jgi:arylsulfatase A-like enzyme
MSKKWFTSARLYSDNRKGDRMIQCISNHLTTGLLAMTFSLVSKEAASAERPNIVFIMADDLGFSDLGCYGGEVATPNLDRLASRGVRFSQNYNCGKCEPTRTALMTGHRNTPQIGYTGENAKTFMPAVLKEQGYRTLMTGKWHVSGHPMDRGFEHFFGIEEGVCNFYTGSSRIKLNREKFKVPAQGFYTTDAFTDYALNFLDAAKAENDKQPFFLYLAYTAPHDPLQAPEDEISKYREKYMDGWEVVRQRRFDRIKESGLIPQDARLPDWPQNLPRWQDLTDAQKWTEDIRMATYSAMIDRMDQNIGRIFQWLENNGKWDNTLIVFTSDNGSSPFQNATQTARMVEENILPGGSDSRWSTGTAWAHVSDTPFRLYKRNQHEGGICAPLILHWPAAGYDSGSISSMPVHILDFLPTFYALAGGTRLLEGIEGTDLSDLWKTGAQNRNFEMMGYLFDQRYIRRNDWKLVAVDGQPWELFNLRDDRTETMNRIAENPELANELKSAWEQWYGLFSDEIGQKTTQPTQRMGDQGSGFLYVPSALTLPDQD